MDASRIERDVGHRPWPMPRSQWVLHQSWRNLLFAHWAVHPDTIRPRVPWPLELDLYDGRAWIAITPFLLTDFTTRWVPSMRIFSAFPELNLRTYVRAAGKPGVHFFSLDAGNRAAVMGARLVFRLPYRKADMRIEEVAGRFRITSERRGGEARFRASWAPTGPAAPPAPGTLEHFLTERYALFTVVGGSRIIGAEIHHGPWRLHPAECEVEANALADAERVPLPAGAPLVHFSGRQDTLIWPPRAVRPKPGFAPAAGGS